RGGGRRAIASATSEPRLGPYVSAAGRARALSGRRRAPRLFRWRAGPDPRGRAARRRARAVLPRLRAPGWTAGAERDRGPRRPMAAGAASPPTRTLSVPRRPLFGGGARAGAVS